MRNLANPSGEVRIPDRTSRFSQAISERIQKGDFGLWYAPWNAMMAMGFYATGLENLGKTYPHDLVFQTRAKAVLQVLSNTIDASTGSVEQYGIPNGEVFAGWAIYQANLLRIHKALAYFDRNEESNFHSLALRTLGMEQKADKATIPSYPGYGWYVDNAEIYAAFADSPKASDFSDQIRSWTGELSRNLGPGGLPLAEAYTRSSDPNQVRWSAAGWVIWAILKVDHPLFDRWFPIFENEFYLHVWPFGGIRDVPRGEPTLNRVFDGPHIGPLSTSATILSVPTFTKAGRTEEAQSLLLTFDTLFFAPDVNAGSSWIFWGSALLDALRFWAESEILLSVRS